MLLYFYNLLNNFIFGHFLQLLVPLLISIALYTLGERKLMASMQRRVGPNVVGIFGILQPFADAIKLLFKEIIIPLNTNRLLFLLAPLFFLILSLSLWILIPVIELPLLDIIVYNTKRPYLLYNDDFFLEDINFFFNTSSLFFHFFHFSYDFFYLLENRQSFNYVGFSSLDNIVSLKFFYKNSTFYMPYNVLFFFFLSSLSIFGIIISGWSSNSKYPLLGAIRSGAQMISY